MKRKKAGKRGGIQTNNKSPLLFILTFSLSLHLSLFLFLFFLRCRMLEYIQCREGRIVTKYHTTVACMPAIASVRSAEI